MVSSYATPKMLPAFAFTVRVAGRLMTWRVSPRFTSLSMGRVKQFLSLLAIIKCSITSFATAQMRSPWQGEEITVTALEEALEACRTADHASTSWTISGYVSGQARLPVLLSFQQTSFMAAPPLSEVLDIAPQTRQSGILETTSAITRLAELISESRCPIEVRGFASIEGSRAQNIELAEARRDAMVQLLLEAGAHPAILTIGEANVSQTFENLAANRRVEIRIRSDLAWHCHEFSSARDLFPVHGIWRIANASTLSSAEQLQGKALMKALKTRLAIYPCQTIYHVSLGPSQRAAVKELLASILGISPQVVPPFRVVGNSTSKTSIFFGIPEKDAQF